MIANNQAKPYKCSKKESESDATFVCVEKDFDKAAFMCSHVQCECFVAHEYHQTRLLSGISKEVSKLLQLSGKYNQAEKQLDDLIDGLIKELERLRAHHKQHLQGQLGEWYRNVKMEKKLSQRAPLQALEATGQSFWKLINNVKTGSQMVNPYSLPTEDLQKVLADTKEQFSRTFAKLKDLWVWMPKEFSSILKHPSLTLTENNMRISMVGGGCAVCLVEPQVKPGTPLKMSFKINQTQWAGVGICLKSVVTKANYGCNYNQLNNGVYMNLNTGQTLSHTHAEDCYKPRGIKYAAGEVVSVEFNPVKNTIVYSVEGANPRRFEQATKIDPKVDEAVHFCVLFYYAGESFSINQ